MRQRPTFKEGYQYLINDDTTIELPQRRALEIEGSFERNQSKDFSVDRATEMQLRMQQAQYLATDNQMPYGPNLNSAHEAGLRGYGGRNGFPGGSPNGLLRTAR